jgi:hypothetical protein
MQELDGEPERRTLDVGDGVVARFIGREHNAAMLDILRRCPTVTPELDLCFDRQPNIFLCSDLHFDHYQCAGLFRGNELLGFGVVGYELLHINGTPTPLFTLTDVYFDRQIRGHNFAFKTMPLFCGLVQKHARYGCTVIIHGNVGAEKGIQCFAARLRMKKVADQDIRTLLITIPKNEQAKLTVRQATLDDVDAVVRMLQEDFSRRLFGPVVDRDTFVRNLERRPNFGIDSYYLALRKGEIVGVCAAWDTKPFKQNRVLRYRGRLKLVKGMFGLGGKLAGFAPLPQEGAAFRDVHIIDYTTRDRDPDIMRAMLTRIYNVCRAQRYNAVIFGSSADDPLLSATKSFYSESVLSQVLLFDAEPDKPEPQIDGTLPYLNIAVL